MLMATCLIVVSSWPDQVRGKTTGFLTARFPLHNELANSSPCAPEGQEEVAEEEAFRLLSQRALAQEDQD